jgi:predicted dehydrogenase/nucleoside-diphosphate-sugar epimerase
MSSLVTTLPDAPADDRSRRQPAASAAAIDQRPQRFPVAIVGAGYISGYHLEVLRQLGTVDVVGACDPDAARLESLCSEWRIPAAAPSLGELLRRSRPAAVHVLVPPPYHFDVAREALEAGLHVLVEKPMALHASDVAALIDLAKAKRVCLRVNHNALFHPAFRRLLADVAHGRLGRIEHVVSVNNLPLAQLDAGDHDHWMFREPANILYEQATHPLSQICELLGAVRAVAVTRSGRRVLKTGTVFHTAWQMSLTCERGTAQLFIAFGRSFSESTVQVIGQDAATRLDLLNNTYTIDRATKYLEPVDRALRSWRLARDVARDGSSGLIRYVASTLRLQARSDPYYVSMLGGIDAFYKSLREAPDAGSSALDGLQVVKACELASESVSTMSTVSAFSRPERATAAAAVSKAERRTARNRGDEIVVFGGAGFIGRHLVAALARAGHPVRVMTRRSASSVGDVVAGVDHQPIVQRGDIRSSCDVARAVEGCRTVIHLVSGAPANWTEYERLFVEGTRHVAEACRRFGAEQLLFASSIAVYYLGRQGDTITEDTPLDDSPHRSEYTRAKVACERVLSQLHREFGLPVTIFRPGVVVGAGGSPAHLGVGFWPTPTHCVSWGLRTRGPLPFVLANDVAAALVAAIGRRDLTGQSFNLVGDVGLSAEEYIQALREASGRDIQLHRQSILKWYGVDLAKWAIKAAARKPENAFPSRRNFASWALRSSFDCSRAKRLLGWTPVADRQRFIDLGVRRAIQEDA